MKRRLDRWGVLFLVSLLLGVAVGGLLSQALLFEYGVVPVRWLLLATPVVGAVLYWWTDRLEELLSTISVSIVIAGLTTLLAFLTPLFVVRTSTVAEQNILLLNALSRTFLHLGLAAVLVVVGVVVTAVAYRERLVPDRLFEHRGEPSAILVVLTVMIVMVAGTLAVPLVRNYGSAVEQRGVDPSVDRVCYFPEEDTIYVSIGVPNRLTDRMWIDSYLFQIRGVGPKPIALRGFPNEPIPAGETGTVGAWIEVDNNVSAALEDPARAEISGYIYAEAFNDFSTRLDLPTTAVTIDQCGNETGGTGAKNETVPIAMTGEK